MCKDNDKTQEQLTINRSMSTSSKAHRHKSPIDRGSSGSHRLSSITARDERKIECVSSDSEPEYELTTIGEKKATGVCITTLGLPASLRGATLRSLREDLHQLLAIDPGMLRGLRSLLFPQWRMFPFTLGVSLAVSTDASGNWNSSTAGFSTGVSGFTAASEWASLQALFDEVFVVAVEYHWMPHNQYVTVNPFTAAAFVRCSVGLSYVSLHHGASTYTTLATALVNPSIALHQTNLPHTYVWRNVEKCVARGPSTTSSGTAIPTQGWCNTNTTSIGAYTGTMQSQTSTTLTGGISAEQGRYAARYQLVFRNRA